MRVSHVQSLRFIFFDTQTASGIGIVYLLLLQPHTCTTRVFLFFLKKIQRFYVIFPAIYFAIACLFIYWSLPRARSFVRFVFIKSLVLARTLLYSSSSNSLASSLALFVCACVCARVFVFVYHFSQHKFGETMHKEWYEYTQYGSRCFDLEPLPQQID